MPQNASAPLNKIALSNQQSRSARINRSNYAFVQSCLSAKAIERELQA